MRIAIIGSGIAGLYFAYYIKKYKKNLDILHVYEKNKYIGGRVKMTKFDDISVVEGAGIGRLDKDKLLHSFCKELDVIKSTYKVQKSYTFNPIDVVNVVDLLKKYTQHFDRSKYTFKQFATTVLGKELYDKFILSVGETDYENEDFIDTLYDYGFEHFNSQSGFSGFSIDWDSMLSKLYKYLEEHIKLNTMVKNIYFDERNKTYIINNQYPYDKIIFATEITTVQKILNIPIYDNIKCQPFVRLYVKLDSNILNHKSFIVTEKPFQKIIEMNKEKCIYMISYSDNKIAVHWKSVKDIKSYVKKYIKEIFKQDVNVLKHKLIFWECGTHYYKPLPNTYKDRDEYLKYAQNPFYNIYVTGEAFSRDQGWCEGALQSVHNILKNF